MTTCTITGFACNCQPDEGVPCGGLAELRKAYAEWRTKAEQLRGTLSLAEEGLANYAEENGALKARLERIEQARFTWAMACECYCAGCMGLDKLIRGAEPQSPVT